MSSIKTKTEMRDDQMSNKQLPKALKKIRMDNNYTTYSLAAELGVNHSTITYWENGDKFPRQKKLMQLEDLFGVSWRELFEDLSPEEAEELEKRKYDSIRKENRDRN